MQFLEILGEPCGTDPITLISGITLVPTGGMMTTAIINTFFKLGIYSFSLFLSLSVTVMKKLYEYC